LQQRHVSAQWFSQGVISNFFLSHRFVKARLTPAAPGAQALYELSRIQDDQFVYTTASLDETVALCGLQKLLKGGSTNLPLAASIKIQARAKGMLQRKRDREKQVDQASQPPPSAVPVQQASLSAPTVVVANAAPAVADAASAVAEPPISLESLPKGIHPSIIKLAKVVAEQRRSCTDVQKKAAAAKAALQQLQQERLATQARAERAEEELRFFRAAESRSNSRASLSNGHIMAPSTDHTFAAIGAAHQRAAAAEAEVASLQAKVTKLQNEITSVRSETLDGFKTQLSNALAEVSSLEREVRVQVGPCCTMQRTAAARSCAFVLFRTRQFTSVMLWSVAERGGLVHQSSDERDRFQ
jgi:hypothetical protein